MEDSGEGRKNSYTSIKIRQSELSALFTLYLWVGNKSNDDLGRRHIK
jgi:hypothetical protein